MSTNPEKPKKKKAPKVLKPGSVDGRPRVFDDEKFNQLAAFCRLKPSLLDCAAFFQCGQTTIEDEVKQRTGLTFREFREQNLVHTRYDLIRTVIKKAKQGDGKMLKYALANLSDWKSESVISNNLYNMNVSKDPQLEESPTLKKIEQYLTGESQETIDVTPVKIDADSK